MKTIKVNADYESVLFFNKPLPQVNETIEFLAFYLDSRPLITSKKYSEVYFDHVESFTGHRPLTQTEGHPENWWGSLTNLDVERKLNSKEMSSEFNPDSYVVSKLEELPELSGKRYLAKNPFGMSGQNFSIVEEGRLQNLEVMLKKGKVVVEPLFNRLHDFSHYVFPNGVTICYENIVDGKFQYRGTVFRDYTNPVKENLRFFSSISGWETFNSELSNVITAYSTAGLTGFSVDSFTYEEEGVQKIRTISEVNYRRTMGRVAFELALRFGGIRKWSAMLLTKSRNDFLDTKRKLLPIEWEPDTSRGVIYLSPGDTRYDIFFLSAINEEEGMMLVKEMRELLPDSEFTIEF